MADVDTEADLFDLVRRVRIEDPVCVTCLGRLVADRSFGLSNTARGEALRTTLALVEDEPYEPPDPSDCWVCEGQSTRMEAWAEKAVEAVQNVEFRTYQVGCRVPPLLDENDRLLRELMELSPDVGEPLKSELNREVGKRLGQETETTVDFERPDVLLLLHLERGAVELTINPAFVFGRYRKLRRDIPQTEWPCRECGGRGKQVSQDGPVPCEYCDGTGYLYETSVEEEIVPHIQEAMNGSDGLFHGAGREDVDAKMLGRGRPFVVEIKEPRSRFPDVESLQEQINRAAEGRVAVDSLQLASYEMVERVKELEASKTYRVNVSFGEPVTETDFEQALERLSGATIRQRTPNRVSHRRADKHRTRVVKNARGDLESSDRAKIEIHGEGGLYIKELMTGDEGRTTPSLAAELGIEVTVESLDVTDVSAEEGPFCPEKYVVDPPGGA